MVRIRLVCSAHQEWMRSALGARRRAKPRGLPPCRRSLRLMAEPPTREWHLLPGLLWPVQLTSPDQAGISLDWTACDRPRSCCACDAHANCFVLLQQHCMAHGVNARTHHELAPHGLASTKGDLRDPTHGWSNRFAHRLRGPDSASASAAAANGDDGSARFLPAAGVKAGASAPETRDACRCRQVTVIKHEQNVSKGLTQIEEKPSRKQHLGQSRRLR